MLPEAINKIKQLLGSLLMITRGQTFGLDAVFIMGASLVFGAVFYVVGNEVLKLNYLQNVGLFPVALLLLSIIPVLIGLVAVFRPR